MLSEGHPTNSSDRPTSHSGSEAAGTATLSEVVRLKDETPIEDTIQYAILAHSDGPPPAASVPFGRPTQSEEWNQQEADAHRQEKQL